MVSLLRSFPKILRLLLVNKQKIQNELALFECTSCVYTICNVYIKEKVDKGV